MALFNHGDFRVFAIPGFEDRMHALRERIQPRLASIGADLVGEITALLDQPVYCHVARHARRKVHPPDDTWVAFGPDKRGYKKDVHFKLSLSRNSVRLLFEVGPEYYDKSEWVRSWQREFGALSPLLRGGRQLGWFRDEHDDEPRCLLRRLDLEELRSLGKEPLRSQEGQLVIGRRLDEDRMIAITEAGFRKVARDTFRRLAPLFSLHQQRVLNSKAR